MQLKRPSEIPDGLFTLNSKIRKRVDLYDFYLFSS